MPVRRTPSHTGRQSGAKLRVPGFACEVAMLIRITLPLAALLALVRLQPPGAPAPDKPPEPQATHSRRHAATAGQSQGRARNIGKSSGHQRRRRGRIRSLVRKSAYCLRQAPSPALAGLCSRSRYWILRSQDTFLEARRHTWAYLKAPTLPPCGTR